jgi:hypothetical protein
MNKKRLTFPGPYFGDRTYDPTADRARLAKFAQNEAYWTYRSNIVYSAYLDTIMAKYRLTGVIANVYGE